MRGNMAPPKVEGYKLVEFKTSDPAFHELKELFKKLVTPENPGVGLDITTEWTVLKRGSRVEPADNNRGTPINIFSEDFDYVAKLPSSLKTCVDQWYSSNESAWFFLNPCFVAPFNMNTAAGEALYSRAGGLLPGEGVFPNPANELKHIGLTPEGKEKDKLRAKLAGEILLKEAVKYMEIIRDNDTLGAGLDIVEVRKQVDYNFNAGWFEEQTVTDKKTRVWETLDGVDGVPDAVIRFTVIIEEDYPQDKLKNERTVWASGGGVYGVYFVYMSPYEEPVVLVRSVERDAKRTIIKDSTDSPAPEDKE